MWQSWTCTNLLYTFTLARRRRPPARNHNHSNLPHNFRRVPNPTTRNIAPLDIAFVLTTTNHTMPSRQSDMAQQGFKVNSVKAANGETVHVNGEHACQRALQATRLTPPQTTSTSLSLGLTVTVSASASSHPRVHTHTHARRNPIQHCADTRVRAPRQQGPPEGGPRTRQRAPCPPGNLLQAQRCELGRSGVAWPCARQSVPG